MKPVRQLFFFAGKDGEDVDTGRLGDGMKIGLLASFDAINQFVAFVVEYHPWFRVEVGAGEMPDGGLSLAGSGPTDYCKSVVRSRLSNEGDDFSHGEEAPLCKQIPFLFVYFLKGSGFGIRLNQFFAWEFPANPFHPRRFCGRSLGAVFQFLITFLELVVFFLQLVYLLPEVVDFGRHRLYPFPVGRWWFRFISFG